MFKIQKNIIRIALAVIIILLIPLALTLLNPNAHLNGGAGGGFDWSPGDFLIMGIMLFAVGLAVGFVWRKMGKYRTIGIIVIVLLFLWLWAELAVGVFTNWGS